MLKEFMRLNRRAILIVAAIATVCLAGGAEAVELFVRPSQTEPATMRADEPHYVSYDPQTMGARLLVFIPGTGGAARADAAL
jgi:hypothetical protein